MKGNKMNLTVSRSILYTFGCIAVVLFGQLKASSQLNQFGIPPILKDRDALIAKVKQLPWEEPSKIISLIEPSIIPLIDSSIKSSTGQSKFGGMPDLPASWNWPTFKNKPMVFLGQVNLKEVSAIYSDSLLPKQGILFFFCFFNQPENEYGPSYEFKRSNEEYKVLYFNGNKDQLKRRPFPEKLYSGYHFASLPIRFELIHYFPNTTETYRFQKAGLNRNDELLFNEMTDLSGLFLPDMILGTPSPRQYGADYDWAYAFLKVPLQEYENPVWREKVNTLVPDFINLFSFALEDKFKILGYTNCNFGIRKQDLKTIDFDNTVFIMQGN
jgi:uncharacterized protein YwqG